MKKLALVLSLFAFLVGCGDDHDHDHENNHNHEENNHEGGVAEEICEHMGEGPFESVTASETEADANSINFEHTRVDMSFVDGDTTQQFFTYPSAMEADYVFAFNQAATVVITDAMGNIVEAEREEAELAECSDLVKYQAVYELGVGLYTVAVDAAEGLAVVVEVETHNHE